MLRSAILLVFLISGFSVFGQCNLQAHFRLDGNAGDSSSFANHATVYGAVPTNDRFNQPNGAMYFDGVNDYINTFSTFDYQERTVSFWFKPERITGSNSVLIQDANTLTYGAFSLRVLNGDMRGRAGQASDTLIYPNTMVNQWYHVALVRRNDSAIYYINGVKTGGVLSGNGGSSASPYDKLVIGAGRERNTNFFKGVIDDIKIFDCVFSALQVDSLYNDNSANLSSPTCLVADYKLDGNAADSSVFAHNGSIFGGATATTDRFNQANGAMYFDGVNDYINTFTTFDIPYRTVSIWMKPERASGLNQVMTQDAASLVYGAFGFRITNGRLDGNSAGNSSQALANITLNQWYHLVLVSRPDSGFCYINGVRVIAAAATSTGSASGAYNKLVLGVGRQRNTNFFKGSLDDLQIYNCALSATEVDSLFNINGGIPQICVMGDYRLDGNGIDSSSFANHATLIGNPTAAIDRFNQNNGALYFDGTNDYLNTLTTYDFPYRTLSIWVYPERSTGLNQILVQDAASLAYGAFGARISNGTLLAGSAGNAAQASPNVTLNEWFHLALVSRPDSGFCYINGQRVIAAAATSNGSFSNAYDKLVLAVARERNQKYFEGRLDDLLILSCDLSPQEIDSLFIAQSPFPPLDTLSLDTILCLGDSLYFDLDGGLNISYFWDNGSIDTVRTITNPGTYTLRQIRGGDTLIDTIRLSFTNPYIPTSLDTSFCIGDSLNVDFSALSADSLVWFDGDTSRQRTFKLAGTFYFWVYQNVCGFVRDSIQIKIDSLLSPQTTDTSTCQDTLSIGVRRDILLSYLWSTGQTTPRIQINSSGIYTLELRGACNTIVDTFRVNLPVQLPDPIYPDTLFICANSDSAQIGLNINPNLSFNWSNGSTSEMQWVKLAGDYSLQIFNSCDTLEINYRLRYKSVFEPEPIQDTGICEAGNLVFDLNNPLVQSVSVNGRTLFDNILTISERGSYIIEYRDVCGLTVDSFDVDIVACECDFIMPDAFTPNGDGLNDRFRIDNECEDLEHSIQIFNRWGVLVFENKSSNDYWDGTHNGRSVSGGVYIYKMNYSGSINNQSYEGFKQGFITLIR